MGEVIDLETRKSKKGIPDKYLVGIHCFDEDGDLRVELEEGHAVPQEIFEALMAATIQYGISQGIVVDEEEEE